MLAGLDPLKILDEFMLYIIVVIPACINVVTLKLCLLCQQFFVGSDIKRSTHYKQHTID